MKQKIIYSVLLSLLNILIIQFLISCHVKESNNSESSEKNLFSASLTNDDNSYSRKVDTQNPDNIKNETKTNSTTKKEDQEIIGEWKSVRGNEVYQFKADGSGSFKTTYVSVDFNWKSTEKGINLRFTDGGFTTLKLRKGVIEEYSEMYGTTFRFVKKK